MFRTIVNWGWSPVLVTALAVLGLIYGWEVWMVVPALIIIMVIGLVVVVVGARGKELWLLSQRFRQQAGYFTRRFTGNSSLSIFAIIDSLFKIDNPEVWNWARTCDASQRIFNTWCDSFIARMESDVKTRNLNLYLRIYLNELWLIIDHYYEFVEQFYEVAKKVQVPQETVDQYNRFVVEYNAFVNDFRDNVAELKKFTRTQIEPPGVKLAKELSVTEPLQAPRQEEEKPSQPDPRKGYIM